MRILFGISTAIALAIVITLIATWTNLATQAKQQNDAVSMDPLAMTATVTNLLPEVHYDHGFVFPEQQ
jgi:hypothetical protein